MKMSEFIGCEWLPTLGCTEPASIAFAAAVAAEPLDGWPTKIRLTVDARTYKNCFAVGIPRSGGKTGILWAVALGACLPPTSIADKLQCFKNIEPVSLERAGKLVSGGKITVDVSQSPDIMIDCVVVKERGWGRTVIMDDHENIVHRELDGVAYPLPGNEEISPSSPLPFDLLSNQEGIKKPVYKSPVKIWRERLSSMPLSDIMKLSADLTPEDRKLLAEGMDTNLEMAEYCMTMLPPKFITDNSQNIEGRLATLVCAGVYGRMSGVEKRVFAASGSGNKGIVLSIPIMGYCTHKNFKSEKAQEALSLALLITSKTTHHLGSLSAACGCSNAAGMGLAAAITMLEGGKEDHISKALTNMVGNVTGMICDGAKIGCALKTMTSVDAAFRCSSLALAGVGIPYTDGIVGKDSEASLVNIGRISNFGMQRVDDEILKIMSEKLRS